MRPRSTGRPAHRALCETLETRRLLSTTPDGVIVFMTNRDGNYEIYSMAPDGSHLKNLTNNSALDAIPQVSDDGTMVAFSSDRGHPGQQDVYTMNIDGSNVKDLTPGSAAFDWDPALSPDKKKILFMSDRTGKLDIWVANAADGSSPVDVTADSPYGGDFASWSDDGTKIVYGGYIGNNEEIFTMNADGSHKVQLTNSPGRDTYPAFSPDGTKIVFTSERDGNREIYLMNSDGSNPVNLTKDPGVDQVPYFNDDGDHISFMSYRNGDGEIYIMNLDGSAQTRITNNPAQDAYPSWGETPPAPALPVLSIGDTSVVEGNTGTRTATFTVNLSAPALQPVSVGWATAGITATAGSDFASATGTLTFAAGVTSKTVSVTVNGDYLVEPDETFAVNLSSAANATIGDAQGIAVISNDDLAGTLAFSTSTYTAGEAAGSATITVTRVGGVGNTVSIAYATQNGSAIAPADYTAKSGTLTWAAGDATAKTFAVPIVNDTAVEGNETVSLVLSNISGGATLGSPQSATLNIVDDDVPPPPSNGQIFYQSTVNGTYNIFSMNTDGTGVVNLSNTTAGDTTPAVSTDGSVLVFGSNRADGKQFDIYRMNGDGSGVTRLTTDPGLDYEPSMSPDKSKIVFVSTRSGSSDVWVMNSDGTNQKNLTAGSTSNELYPSFGSTGKILFSSDRVGGKMQVYSINPDGTGLLRLTTTSANDSNAVFSPDGSKIAFQSDRDGNREIYVMNANGTGVTRLTNNAAVDEYPAFSPDGKKIAFQSFRDGNGEIYTMNVDGTLVTRLTNNTQQDSYPTWSTSPIGGPLPSALSRATPINTTNQQPASDLLVGSDPLGLKKGLGV